MDLSHFRLHSGTLEVRYDAAYLVWDRAGLIWHDIKRKHPGLTIVESVPNRVVANIDRAHQATIEVQRFAATFYPPKGTREAFYDLCAEALDILVPGLRVNSFSRIGLRLLYRRSYKNRDELSQACLATPFFKYTFKDRLFGISGQPQLPSFGLRWEGPALGVTVGLRANERKMTFEPPIGDDAIDRVEKEFFDLDYDFDYYTTVPVETEQFRAREWMDQAFHMVRRDSGEILGS